MKKNDSQKNESTTSKLSQKATFFIGFGSALGLLFAIGFFVMLGILLNKDDGSELAKNSDSRYEVTKPSKSKPDDNINYGNAKESVTVLKSDWIRGDKDAKVSIIEYSDIDCPFCARFHPTMKQIVDYYDGQVNWVYRHFPLISLHPDAPKKAEATECAGEQKGNEGFWTYLDYLFKNEVEVGELTKVASDLGLNEKEFEKCLSSGKYAQKVSSHAKNAQFAGAKGTPYSVIISGDKIIPASGAMSFEQLKSRIEPLL